MIDEENLYDLGMYVATVSITRWGARVLLAVQLYIAV
jgi:hypothetical protein